MRFKAALLICLLSGTTVADEFALDQSALRAQLTPLNYVTLSAGMTGRISRLTVHEGDSVKKQQVLIEFDCDLQRAQLEKATAQHALAINTHKGNQRMSELTAIGQVELVNGELEVRKAKADVDYLKATIKRCSIISPYAGVVGDQLVRENQFVQEGEPLLEILDTRSLQLEFIVPSRWLAWLKPGFAFDVDIEDTGKNYPVKLSYTAGKVDALSQSIKAVAVIDGEYPELKPGMSGFIKLTPAQASNQ